MIQKLYAAVSGQCALETHDNPMNQEVLLGGHVYLRQLKVMALNFNRSSDAC